MTKLTIPPKAKIKVVKTKAVTASQGSSAGTSKKKTPAKETPTALTELKPEQVVLIPLKDITPSGTNPRKTFNEEELQELADSIQSSGLVQPIIVRLTGKDYDKKYEIVAGERRFRAVRMLLQKEIKSIVRELTDDEVLQIQIIENLQRADVAPIEEGQGYAVLHGQGMSIRDIAGKVGKSPEYIAKRMKLVDLIPEVQAALKKDVIMLEHAKHIAPLQPSDQKRAFKELSSTTWMGRAMTPNQLRDWIDQNCTLDLSKATFDKEDVNLANAGPCKNCFKNTGCNRDLFGSVNKGSYCTDAGCFNAKTDAHIKFQEKEIKNDGKMPIYLSSFYNSSNKAWVSSSDYKVIGTGQNKKCDLSQPGIIMDGPERGKVVKVCIDKKCEVHYPKEKGKASSSDHTSSTGSSGNNGPTPDERFYRKNELILEKETGDMADQLIGLSYKLPYIDSVKREVAKKIFRALDGHLRNTYLESKEVKAGNNYDGAEKAFDKWVVDVGTETPPPHTGTLDGLIIELSLWLDITFNRDSILNNFAVSSLINLCKYNLPEYAGIEPPVKSEHNIQRVKALTAFKRINEREPSGKKLGNMYKRAYERYAALNESDSTGEAVVDE